MITSHIIYTHEAGATNKKTHFTLLHICASKRGKSGLSCKGHAEKKRKRVIKFRDKYCQITLFNKALCTDDVFYILVLVITVLLCFHTIALEVLTCVNAAIRGSS